ncbi:rhomboid family intramembrane serine protease [Cucumibacter marinus]|uniref:rhomboid family intramembrane serine protease n=1 Tax=Cucumibacter marinus TaxID=1121252 RepID=UPI0004031E50|nr:rhomboid family intramembrane serine protease [Cucumibacter marinus]
MFYPVHDSNPIRYLKREYVNWSIILATFLIFVVQLAMPVALENRFFVAFGMVPGVVQGIYADPFPLLPDKATLVTYAFLHADFWHVATNMLFLWVFGDNVEDAMGHARYLVFYVVCAIAAALAHMLFNFGSSGPLIGASGAVAGVIGAYLVLYPKVRVMVIVRLIIPLPVPVPALWALGAWIGLQLVFALIPNDDPVAWWAHIGGFIAGVALIPLFKRRELALFGR